jgi:hypothetical protein
MSPLLLSLCVAGITVVLQVWLKIASRQRAPGARRLSREDLVWWLDWVIAAAIAFTVLAVTEAHAHRAMEVGQVLLLVLVTFCGFGGLPVLVREWGYEPASTAPGSVPSLRTWRGIVLPNLAGAIVLLAAVSAGAKLG